MNVLLSVRARAIFRCRLGSIRVSLVLSCACGVGGCCVVYAWGCFCLFCFVVCLWFVLVLWGVPVIHVSAWMGVCCVGFCVFFCVVLVSLSCLGLCAGLEWASLLR